MTEREIRGITFMKGGHFTLQFIIRFDKEWRGVTEIRQGFENTDCKRMIQAMQQHGRKEPASGRGKVYTGFLER